MASNFIGHYNNMDKYCYLFSGDYLMFSNTQDISSLSLDIQSDDLDAL